MDCALPQMLPSLIGKDGELPHNFFNDIFKEYLEAPPPGPSKKSKKKKRTKISKNERNRRQREARRARKERERRANGILVEKPTRAVTRSAGKMTEYICKGGHLVPGEGGIFGNFASGVFIPVLEDANGNVTLACEKTCSCWLLVKN